MNDTLKTMIRLWKVKDTDWLGYENQERYSYHHLKKKSDGGKTTIENGAILHQSSHQYLHTIEFYELDRYIFLNTILRQINEQRSMPSIEQLKEIKLALMGFQNEFDGKLNARGKLIIKKEYLLTK